VSSARGRVGIVGPYGWLGTVPSLSGLIQALIDSGQGVDIYACQHEAFPPPSFPGRDVRFFVLPEKQHQGKPGWRWRFITQWTPYLIKQYHRESYKYIIGVDPWGLVLASLPARLCRIPVIYLSLELRFWRETKSAYLKILKILERHCNRKAAFTIIQDKDRAELIMAENGVPANRIEFLPNAPAGEAKLDRSERLHKALGIPGGRPIVLHLGSLSPGTLCLELAQHAKEWDVGAALVFHTRSLMMGDYGTVFRQKIDGAHTFLSAEPVEGGLVRSLVASADVGIALYATSNQDKNVFTMGLSSGKIAHYLQCGLPVVATALPTVQRYVEGYRCGICVDRVSQVGGAIKAILDNYAEYSKNALTCFKQEFDLDKYLVPIMQRADKLIRTGSLISWNDEVNR
jgi:glycosyltransferase involved in cell wall biosynthesis